MKPVDFVKALGLAILVLALDLLCAFAFVFCYTLIYPPVQPLTPADPLVVELSSLSTRIFGPILFALFVWLFSRKRPDRNACAFGISVFGAYLLIDLGMMYALPPDPSGKSPMTLLLERGFLGTMALKLLGALAGAWLATRRAKI